MKDIVVFLVVTFITGIIKDIVAFLVVTLIAGIILASAGLYLMGY